MDYRQTFVYFVDPMRRFFSPIVLAAAAVYLLLTVALTWPLILHPTRLVPNDLGDPLLNTWILSWDARVMPLTRAWWNGLQFYPVDGTLAFSEHLLGLSIFTTPVIVVTGNPLLAYNIVFVLTFVLSALAAYYLAFTISRRHDCAFLAGLAFAFAPYRMAQFAHVQVLSAYWMPIALAALHRYFDDLRARWLVLFGVSWVMQALACGYYLFYLSVLIVLWLPWFVHARSHWRAVARLAIAWTLAAAALAPVMYGYWKYQHEYGFKREIDEIVSFSADVASVLQAPGSIYAWGWLHVVHHPESDIFPGLTVILLIVLGLVIGWRTAATERIGRLRIARIFVGISLFFFAIAASPAYFGPWKLEIGPLRLLSVSAPHKPFSIGLLFLVAAGVLHPSVRTAWRRRSALTFYALAAVVMWLFSLGPAPTLLEKKFIYKAPYAWLMLLPGVDGIRVPARFWMLAALCLAVAAALALRQLTAKWPRAATIVPVVACIGVLMDGWPRPIVLEKVPAWRPIHTRAVARLELPTNPQHDAIVLYRTIEHHRPVFNGYSGYFAPHYWALQYMLRQHDPDVLARLSAFGPVEVVIDHDQDPGAAWRQFVGSYPHAELVYRDDRYSTFRIERGPHFGQLPKLAGPVLPIASFAARDNEALLSNMVDGNLITRWHAGREQRPGDAMTADLGTPNNVAGVEMLIGGYVTDFPRRLTIETSLDNDRWSQAWSGNVAVIAMSAALEDPLRFTLPFEFQPRPARYVRFTQTGTEDVFYWSIAELRIHAEK
jgi:F5/8 type C domain-containing protein